jgi:hypothetical protein
MALLFKSHIHAIFEMKNMIIEIQNNSQHLFHNFALCEGWLLENNIKSHFFQNSNYEIKSTLEFIHINICGPMFPSYEALVEIQMGNKIKCLKFDNEGEYTFHHVIKLCEDHDIVQQYIMSYTFKQNRVFGTKHSYFG